MVPIDTEWAEPFIYEFCRFTGVNDTHDDQVDAGAHGFNIMYRPAPPVTEGDYAAGGI
jgi:phage terminase large subunit-like protein